MIRAGFAAREPHTCARDVRRGRLCAPGLPWRYHQTMSRFASDYRIAGFTGVCAATGEPLTPGEVCVAALCEREHDEGFDRKDFSLAAWESGARPDRLFSYWKSTVPEPQSSKRVFVDDEVLMQVFERLGDDEREQRIAFRFVLAMVLLRKRKLRMVGRQTKDDRELWLFKQRLTDESPAIEVVNPNLTDDDVVELTAQLAEILQAEL